ncbi:39S ribosomal protein L41-A, mitochondrial [Gracilariopsis chorda]|uniref:39S ribosomal protein L41-A, mitochondrial n=1 Tax=Gracilariopsis chorda TaxID=448386 RepID=A0A2V3II68_9FLOR|nr:39S ribosomal protein L41-A, mitochondrial [Gracilariopsis chorda]|eukprot:PXF41777.1 39S ribosomal protein L41-A, mitochondrial [Gracilariopsis chorda]
MGRFVRAKGGLARKGNASLHPKHGPRFFYKGYGAKSMGRHTRKGAYVVKYDTKVPIYMVPDLEGCELKPYVSYRTPLVKIPPPPVIKWYVCLFRMFVCCGWDASFPE